ncbi:MAG: hypothetical protein SGBAC_010587 [Bacillariaceae sp.]
MREQAKEAAKKLSSLDEMAAKDDYIHTEEFNVKGEKPKEETRKSQNSEEDSTSDAPSPWSLIDQRIFRKEAAETSSIPSAPHSSQASFGSNLTEDECSTPAATDTAIESAPKQSRSVMMSVVTDAMTARQASPEKAEVDDSSVASDSSSDSDSWNDGDEEDPILSMIRSSKGEDDKPKKKKPKKKSSKKEEKPKMHRFLADMADAENQLEIDSQSNGEQAPASSIPLALPATPKELGSWMKNMASNQMNKILRRPDPSQSTGTSAAPPLASTWRSPKRTPNPLHQEYQSQDSTDLLGDDDLKQLAMLKQANSGGKFSAMMGSLHDYRQYGFIAFTLILSGVVYFFKFGALEDGVS